MKNRVQYKKEPKIKIYFLGLISTWLVTCNMPRVVFHESDNANSMGMLSPSKGIIVKEIYMVFTRFVNIGYNIFGY